MGDSGDWDTAPPFRAGDLVLADTRGGEPVPVGRVESVLSAATGDRLLVERAFRRETYLVVPADSIQAIEEDDAFGVRWLIAGVRPADLIAGGVFRRTMGRLMRDPSPPGLPPALDDAASLAALQEAMASDPMTAGGEVTLAVRRGVALLDGWISTVGGKVQADRLARATPGIWAVSNRLTSDEELRVVVAGHLRSLPEAAAQVVDFRLALGRLVLRLTSDASDATSRDVEQAGHAIPGVRSVDVRR
ncbi:MAG: BON domain-containing protein [Chloroflexota bacterium]